MKYHGSHAPGGCRTQAENERRKRDFRPSTFFILAWMANMCKELPEKKYFRKKVKPMI